MVLVVKNTPANAADLGVVHSIPGLGRYHGKGHGNPLQYSGLENPMDRGAWWATVHGVTKGQIGLKWQHARTLMWYVLQESSVHLWSKISIFFLLVLRLVFSLTHTDKNQSCFIYSQESQLLAHFLSLSGSKQAFADLSPRYRLDLWIWEGSAQLWSPTSQAAWAPKMGGSRKRSEGWDGGEGSWELERLRTEPRVFWVQGCLGGVRMCLKWYPRPRGEENGKGLFDWVIFETFLSIAQSV